MPCYQPLLRAEAKHSFKKFKNGKIGTIAHIYSTRHELEDVPEEDDEAKYQLIPCGKCIGCRLDRSREWANRGYLEAKLHEHNYFITLTYNDEHLPMNDFTTCKDIIYPRTEDWKGTLNKRDLQLFFKRLRKKIPKFLYLACGEYGSKEERPHYHAILFGAEFPTESFYEPRLINKEWYYQNKIIEECWTEEVGRGNKTGESLGFSNISEANWNSIAYTARYVVKKHYGKDAEEYYAIKGQEPEFNTSSKRPAIGREYFYLNQEKIMETDKVMIHNKNGTHEVKRPRYFDKLIEKYDEERLKQDKEKRRKRARETAEIKDNKTSLRRKEQLKVEERSKQIQSKQLKRPL